MVWGKEIEVLQALSSTSPAIKSEEYLRFLVHELKSAVEDAKLELGKRTRKKVVKNTEPTKSDAGRSAKPWQASESWQTSEENEPEPELPGNWRPRYGRIWQNYLK